MKTSTARKVNCTRRRLDGGTASGFFFFHLAFMVSSLLRGLCRRLVTALGVFKLQLALMQYCRILMDAGRFQVNERRLTCSTMKTVLFK